MFLLSTLSSRGQQWMGFAPQAHLPRQKPSHPWEREFFYASSNLLWRKVGNLAGHSSGANAKHLLRISSFSLRCYFDSKKTVSILRMTDATPLTKPLRSTNLHPFQVVTHDIISSYANENGGCHLECDKSHQLGLYLLSVLLTQLQRNFIIFYSRIGSGCSHKLPGHGVGD